MFTYFGDAIGVRISHLHNFSSFDLRENGDELVFTRNVDPLPCGTVCYKGPVPYVFRISTSLTRYRIVPPRRCNGFYWSQDIGLTISIASPWWKSGRKSGLISIVSTIRRINSDADGVYVIQPQCHSFPCGARYELDLVDALLELNVAYSNSLVKNGTIQESLMYRYLFDEFAAYVPPLQSPCTETQSQVPSIHLQCPPCPPERFIDFYYMAGQSDQSGTPICPDGYKLVAGQCVIIDTSDPSFPVPTGQEGSCTQRVVVAFMEKLIVDGVVETGGITAGSFQVNTSQFGGAIVKEFTTPSGTYSVNEYNMNGTLRHNPFRAYAYTRPDGKYEVRVPYDIVCIECGTSSVCYNVEYSPPLPSDPQNDCVGVTTSITLGKKITLANGLVKVGIQGSISRYDCVSPASSTAGKIAQEIYQRLGGASVDIFILGLESEYEGPCPCPSA